MEEPHDPRADDDDDVAVADGEALHVMDDTRGRLGERGLERPRDGSDLVDLIGLGEHVLAEAAGTPRGVRLPGRALVVAEVPHAAAARVALTAALQTRERDLIALLHLDLDARPDRHDDTGVLMSTDEGIRVRVDAGVRALLPRAECGGAHTDEHLAPPDL